MTRRIPRWLRVEFLLGLLFLGATLYAIFLEPFWLAVEIPSIPSPRLSEALGEKKIALVSDLYVKGAGQRERALLAALDATTPDFLLLGGGFSLPGDPEVLASLLSTAARGRAAFAILGEGEEPSDALLGILARAKITLLQDQRVTLQGEKGAFDLIGLRWPGALPRLLERRDSSRPVVVWAPSPEILSPMADAFLLEAARGPEDPAVDWHESAGSWRFPQSNVFVFSEGGPHRVRVQRAISGLLLAEIRFTPEEGEPVILGGDLLPPGALKGEVRQLPGSTLGRSGMLIEFGGSSPPVTAPLLAPDDVFETTVDLPAGRYWVTAVVRARQGGQGAVWFQVEGAGTEEGAPRYRLGESVTFPRPEDGIDLILAGGTLGGKVRLFAPFFHALWPGAHSDAYWEHLGGLYDKSGVPLYVTRGLGTRGVPARLFSRPELTIIRFDRQ